MKVVIALVLLMIANILLGSSLAKLKKEWNKEKFLNGLYKAVSIVVGIVLVYIAGHITEEILPISIDGNAISLVKALEIGFLAGYTYYSIECITKIFKILKYKGGEEDGREANRDN